MMQKVEKIKTFWNKRAKKYPRPYDESVYSRTLYVLERIESLGCVFSGKEVLEIGSGTGVYTLPISKVAKRVVAIDPSDEMLKILKEQTIIHNAKNIEIFENFWQDIDIDKKGFRKNFDIVMSAMTPAIKAEEDLIKMESCSRQWCIYIGWGRKRENTVKSEIFKAHGLELKPPGGLLLIQKILNQLGRESHIEFFETSWKWQGSIEEAIEDISAFIEMQEFTPDREKIKIMLKEKFPDGNVLHTTYAEQGFLLWKV